MNITKKKRKEIQEKLRKIKNNQLSFEDKKIIEELLDDTKLGLKLYFEEKNEEFNFDNKMYKIDDFYSIFEEDKEKEIIKNDLLKSNLLIEAENFLALKHLQKIGQKVDVIYIDPPYNTGTGSEFKYNNNYIDEKDSYKHSKWLSFMKKRLIISKDILKEGGTIFITIDDAEQAYLKVLCDEIFGEKNFVASVPIKSNPQGREINGIIRNHEYILIYTISDEIKKRKIDFKAEDCIQDCIECTEKCINCDKNCDKKCTKKCDKDNYTSLVRGGNNSKATERPKRFYPILIKENILKMIEDEEYESIIISNSKKNFDEKIILNLTLKYEKEGYIVVWPKDTNNVRKVWQREFKRVKEEINKDIVVKNGKIVSLSTTKNFSSWMDKKSFSYSHHGATPLKSIIPNTDFNYPKSINSIVYLLKFFSDNDSIILDFFAGSGTTGHAVMDLNKEDGGNRRFILITNNENNIASNTTYERLHRIIKGEGTKKQTNFKWLDKNKPYINENINSNLKYLKLKPIHKIDGNFEEIKINKELYKKEFDNENISIEDINEE